MAKPKSTFSPALRKILGALPRPPGKESSKALAAQLRQTAKDYANVLDHAPSDRLLSPENVRSWQRGPLPDHAALAVILLHLRRQHVDTAKLEALIVAYNTDASLRKRQAPYPWPARRTIDTQVESLRKKIDPYLNRVIKFRIGYPASTLRGLSKSGVDLEILPRTFVLAQPRWLDIELAKVIGRQSNANGGKQDIYASNHKRIDSLGETSLGASMGLFGISADDLNSAIKAEARHIIENWKDSNARFKIYNRPKLGLLDFQSYVPVAGQERSGLRLQPYRTDYFTHRTMHRLLDRLRGRRTELPIDLADFPLIKGRAAPHFLTSVGLNINVVTRSNPRPAVLLARMGTNNANTSAHGKLHVAANEGINEDDVVRQRNGRSVINLAKAISRALKEECAITSSQITKVILCELFVTRDNAETGIHVVVHTNQSIESIRSLRRSKSRDLRREFSGRDLEPVDLDIDTLAKLVTPAPGQGEMTSYYLPGLLESLLDD